MTSIKVLSRSVTRKSLFTSPTLMKSLSGDVEVAGTARCCLPIRRLRCENRPANRPASRETGLEMPCCPANDLLWVQITQSYPNRLRFSSLPCPQSPCHALIFPVFKEGFFLDDALHHLLPWDIELTIDEPVDDPEEEPEV